MSDPWITVFGSATDAEEATAAAGVIAANWMGNGPVVRQFEADFARHLGVPDAVMVNSGSNALHLAVRLLDLPAGSEVVVPSFTWVACAHAIILAGCRPVFCDVDVATMNVTAETVAAQLGPRTRAVMVVHYAGKPVRMDDILALGLPVIEDAAHAVDSGLNGRRCGTMGRVGVFSFDAVKNIASPDGGAVIAHGAEMLETARRLRQCGIGKTGAEAALEGGRWWEHEIVEPFPRYLPNDVAAAVARVQLAKLPRLQTRRQAIWRRYQTELTGVPWLHPPVDAAKDEVHSFFTYPVRLDNGRRDALAWHLYERKIYTTLRYHPLHLSDIYRTGRPLANTEQLARDVLSLPLHPRMSDGDVARVISGVRDFKA
ncbi:MAG: DegT/DnrJ/EryC1/StrS family aminotransferase [Alphaproteobacteria bacterium]|nr:DegT/DnrJ/EryC1/StrS family aminotransferase [Alphaproteobacteria bacterium]